MLTAGHCTGSAQPWYHFGGGGPFATTLWGIHHNTYADLAWYRLATSHTFEPKTFLESEAGPMPQLNNGENIQGMSACHRGKTTGYTCGTVMSVQYQPTYAGACPGGTCEARFVLAGDTEGQGGDSGGPVVAAGMVPVGVFKGSNGATGTNARVWWTKLGNMPAGMDIWVA